LKYVSLKELILLLFSLGQNVGSPRVQGDDEEEDIDDLDNEFNYKQHNGKGPEWQLGQGEDGDLSSSARLESHHRIPRLTSGQQV
jgi:cellulose synthase A